MCLATITDNLLGYFCIVISGEVNFFYLKSVTECKYDLFNLLFDLFDLFR